VFREILTQGGQNKNATGGGTRPHGIKIERKTVEQRRYWQKIGGGSMPSHLKKQFNGGEDPTQEVRPHKGKL